jgi:hypothetical protein
MLNLETSSREIEISQGGMMAFKATLRRSHVDEGRETHGKQ